MVIAGLLMAMVAMCSYGCEYEALHKKLFYFIEQSNVTFSDEDRERHAKEMSAFIEAHRFIKEDRDTVKVEIYDTYIINDTVVTTVIEVKPRTLLSLNSSYHTIYPSSSLESKPLTMLAYACDLVTCDYRIVETLCKAGADPNFKNSAGLYPATCCLRGMIRFYATKDENKLFIDNQLKKFEILYTAVQDAENEDKVPLILDHSMKKLFTKDTRAWLRDLLKKCVYPSKPVQETT